MRDQKRIRVIAAAEEAIPVKPNTAATIAMMRNIKGHGGINDFPLQYDMMTWSREISVCKMNSFDLACLLSARKSYQPKHKFFILILLYQNGFVR